MSKIAADLYHEEALEDQPLLSGATASTGIINRGTYNTINTFLIFFFPALGGLLFGFDIGATSAVLSQLKSSVYSGVTWYATVADSSLLQGTITSIGMFGAMLGSLTCFNIADDLGRRRTLLVASFLFFIGSITEYMSGNPTWDANKGISVLILGRAIYGYACGFAMHGAPAYIGEMSPPQIRGVLVSLKEVFIVLGMVLGYTLGYSYSGVYGGWRSTYGWSSVLAVVMFAGMWHLPYSARWLALKGRINEAKASLRFVTPDLPESEVEAIRDLALKSSGFQQNSTLADDWGRLTSPTIFPAMLAGVGLVVFQQITGQPSVLYYAVTLFDDVGMSSSSSVAISLFKLVMTLFATVTVDKHGRKKLLFIGCSMMLAALLILGTAFMFDYTSASECALLGARDICLEESCGWDTAGTCADLCYENGATVCLCCGAGGLNTQKWVILSALFLYIGGYQVGFGPISWLLISEIFPLEVRGKAVSIAVVMNFLCNTLMTFVFPVELEYIGTSATFFTYALILMFGIYFIAHHVPETKGLSLEEIEEFFLRSAKQQGGAGIDGYYQGGGIDKKDQLKLSPVI